MAHLTYVWQELYLAAMLETDPPQVTIRIHAAQAALDARLHDLHMTDGLSLQDEMQALSDALSGLRILREEVKDCDSGTN